jgi:hypothetical protein
MEGRDFSVLRLSLENGMDGHSSVDRLVRIAVNQGVGIFQSHFPVLYIYFGLKEFLHRRLGDGGSLSLSKALDLLRGGLAPAAGQQQQYDTYYDNPQLLHFFRFLHQVSNFLY